MSERTTTKSYLFSKWVLLSLVEAAVAVGLIYLYRARPYLPGWFQNWYAVVSLAVIAGFGARWMLKRHNWFVRFLAMMSAFIGGVFLLGFLSNWKYGIGPLKIWPDQVDVDGLIQLGVGLYIFLLTALAWKRPPQMVEQPVYSPSVETVMPSQHQPISAGTGRSTFLDLFKPKPRRTVKVGRTRAVRPGSGIKSTAGSTSSARLKRRNPFRGRAKVRLAIVETHRCPYCLEPVSRVDPRGVVECDVCHTLHHKDCWDVTGVCQVPHLNT
jgi:ribosomal protein L37AE/L43A